MDKIPRNRSWPSFIYGFIFVACVLAAMVTGFILGEESGKQSMTRRIQQEAVAVGVGVFVVDAETNTVRFMWKKPIRLFNKNINEVIDKG